MSESWFVVRDGQREGPMSFTALQRLVTAGKVVGADQVWKAGMQVSVAAHSVRGLFDRPSSSEPPPIPERVMGTGRPPIVSVGTTTGKYRKPRKDYSVPIALSVLGVLAVGMGVFAVSGVGKDKPKRMARKSTAAAAGRDASSRRKDTTDKDSATRVTAKNDEHKSEEYRRGWKVGQQRWEEELQGKSTQVVQNAVAALAEQYEHNRNTTNPEVQKTVDYLRGQMDAINTSRMEGFAAQARANAANRRTGTPASNEDRPTGMSKRDSEYKQAHTLGFERGKQVAQSLADDFDTLGYDSAQRRQVMQAALEPIDANLASLQAALRQLKGVGTPPPEELLAGILHAIGMKVGFLTVAVKYLH